MPQLPMSAVPIEVSKMQRPRARRPSLMVGLLILILHLSTPSRTPREAFQNPRIKCPQQTADSYPSEMAYSDVPKPNEFGTRYSNLASRMHSRTPPVDNVRAIVDLT